MNDNAISRAIAERGVAVGCMLFEFDTPRVMRILAAAGVDFALFDLEHTAWDAGSLRRVLAAGRDTGIHTVTRVVRAQYPLVATALDAGSRGVMAPMVESADEARLLVESARYPPLGRRGFGVIMSDELTAGPAAAAERANHDTVVVAQIESAAGVEHADEILAVPGIDAAWVGQFDLSLSLGCPGELEHPAISRRSTGSLTRAVGTARRSASWSPRPRPAPRRPPRGSSSWPSPTSGSSSARSATASPRCAPASPASRGR